METESGSQMPAEFFRIQAVAQLRILLEHLNCSRPPSAKFVDRHMDLLQDYVDAWTKSKPPP